jgi:hypothetical protein
MAPWLQCDATVSPSQASVSPGYQIDYAWGGENFLEDDLVRLVILWAYTNGYTGDRAVERIKQLLTTQLAEMDTPVKDIAARMTTAEQGGTSPA